MLRSIAPRLGGILAAAALTLAVVPSVLAKEGVEVALAAPISADAQPGDTVELFFTVTRITDAGTVPLRGAPVFVRLTGRDGAVTEAVAVEGRTPGQYKATIVIPEGGALGAAFGIHGSTSDADGRATASDVVWPYDGILVAAGPPAAVDPNAFRLPQVTKPQVVVPKYATEAVPPIEPAAAAASGPAFDLRPIGGLALAGLLALATVVIVRRRSLHPTTA